MTLNHFNRAFTYESVIQFEVVWGFSTRPEIVQRARRIGFHVDEKRQYTFGSVRVKSSY